MTVTIRARRESDLPALEAALAAQQPDSRYPFRWPLPFPVRDFIVRDHELTAFVAELEGAVAGHVSVTSVESHHAFAADWSRGALRPASELGCVSVLFVDRAARGVGVGGALLDAAVEWVRAHGWTPVLDVVSPEGAAAAMYRRHGWRTVGLGRPPWLPDDEPDVLLMVLPEVAAPAPVWVAGVVVPGHGVASGRGVTPYPAGTIELQRPHFAARGLDLSDLYPGTVNVDLTPTHWRPTRPEITFERVPWSDLIPPETFSFLPTRLRRGSGGHEHDGWVYYPHPETKPEHGQPETVVEALLPHLPELTVGTRVELALDPRRVRLT